MPSEFSIMRRVEFSETDMAGIVHFSNFFRWMESCENAFYRSLELPIISLAPGKEIGWPRVKATCDYLAPLRFGDEVKITLFVKKLGRRSVSYVFQFRKGEQLCAQGELTAVCVTANEEGRMTAQLLPEVVKEKLQPAPESAWA